MQFLTGKRNMLRNWGIFFISATIFLHSCNGKQKSPSPADLTKEKSQSGNLVVKRYEKALFSLDKDKLTQGLPRLVPEFSFFLGDQWQDTMNILRIYNFLNDPNITELYELTIQKYPDVIQLSENLGDAFGHFREHYPEKQVPAVYTYVSGLNIEQPVFYFDTAMAIGLDLFLGSDEQAYQKAGLPKYKVSRFTPDYLLPACMLAVSDHLIRIDENHTTLLDEMIAAGKALYFLDVTLPETDDRFKVGYSPEQMDWCKMHESDVWSFLIENQLLFSSDQAAISKLITDSPFTSGFGSDSPGRLGAYTGWQIVRSYMQNARNVSLRQLMENTDSQQILKVSRYKPQKR